MHRHCKFIHNINHILIKLTGVERPWKDLLVLERSEPPESPKATTATCLLSDPSGTDLSFVEIFDLKPLALCKLSLTSYFSFQC